MGRRWSPARRTSSAAWRGIEDGRLLAVRREVRARAGPGTAECARARSSAPWPTAADRDRRDAPDDAFARPAARRTGTSPRRSATRAMLAPACPWPPRWPPRAAGRPTRRPSSRRSRGRRTRTAPRSAQDRPEPAASSSGRPGPSPATRRSRARCPPAGRSTALRRVAAVRRGPRPDASRAAARTPRRDPGPDGRRMSPLPPRPGRLLDLPRRADRPRRRAAGDPAHPPRPRADPARPVAMRVGLARAGRARHRGRAARTPRGDRLRGRTRSWRSTTWTSSTSSTSRRSTGS